MSSSPTAGDIERRKSEIREKRIATLLGAYEIMRQKYAAIRENTVLSRSLVAATVEDYLQDRSALVGRLSISGRIQRHKIAGLMTASIVKNKPKMGRPKLPVGEAKGVLIGARFSIEESKAVHDAIKRSGVVKSDWVRARLLDAAKSSG